MCGGLACTVQSRPVGRVLHYTADAESIICGQLYVILQSVFLPLWFALGTLQRPFTHSRQHDCMTGRRAWPVPPQEMHSRTKLTGGRR